jgi:hypothetical protein
MKRYITPNIKTKNVQLQQMIAQSTNGSLSIRGDKNGDNTEDLSKGRRGSWGDLWDEE